MTLAIACRDCGHIQQLSFAPAEGASFYCQRCGQEQAYTAAEIHDPAAATSRQAHSVAMDDEPAAKNITSAAAAATPPPSGLAKEDPPKELDTLHLNSNVALHPPADATPPRTPAHDGLANYQVEEVLGRGGMGVVYKAFDAHLQRTVALKMMNMTGVFDPKEQAAAAQRFEQEATVTGRLQHPGIVPVYQMDRTVSGTPFYTMRPIEGRSLRDILESLRADDTASVAEFPLIRLIRMLAEACRAVAYAHDARVIHRDLKPGNIMVGKYGEVLVIDWGLAKSLDGLGPESLHGEAPGAAAATTAAADATNGKSRETPPLRPDDSNEGYIIGTPAFMSPEQTFGAEHITTRSDVYCLGTILYQILTLTPPFDPEKSIEDLLDAIRYEAVQTPALRAPERNPDPELSRIAMRCLNKLPQDRPETAAAVVQDLDHWLEGRPQFELVYECADFNERELRTRWYVSRGEWECIDGSLQPMRTETNASHCLLMFREPLPGDLKITVEGTILDDPAKVVGSSGHIGVVTHSPNFRGYASYLIDGYVAEAPCLVEGQTAVKLARNDVDIAYGDWPFTREENRFTVCLEVLNAHYTLTINGKEVLSHTEFVQLPGEYVGLFTYGPAVLIHRVKIESAGMQERVSSLRVVKDLVQSGHSDVAVEMLNGLCTHFAGRELSAKAAFQASLIKIEQNDTAQLEYFKRFILDTVYAPFADLVDYQRALKADDIERQADALMHALHRTGAKLARQVALQEACAWEHGHRRIHREVYHRSFMLQAMLERQEWDAESRDRIRDRLIECYTNLDQRLALPYLRELAARPSGALKKGREELSRPETAAMTLSSWVGLVEADEIAANLARTQHLTYHQVLTLPLLGQTSKIGSLLERRPMPQPAAGGRMGLEYFRFSSLGWWREIQALEELGYNFNTSHASAMAQLLYDGDLEKMADTAPEGCDLRLLALLGRFDAVRQRLKPLESRLQALQASNHQPEIPSILPALDREEQAQQLWAFHARIYGRGTTHAIAEIMTGIEPLATCREWRFRWDALNYGMFLGELGLALHLGGRFEEALTIYQELLQTPLSEVSPYTWQQQWARRCLKEQGIDAPPLPEPPRPDMEPARFATLYLGHLGL